jgi:hypothetical protein
MKKSSPMFDAGLQQIDDLEALMIRAHDEKHTLQGASLEEVERFRPAAVQLAKTVCAQLRAAYLARQVTR